MRKLAGVAESNIAPPTNMLWLCKGEARYFSNGKWISISRNSFITNILIKGVLNLLNYL